jgi:energy-coupling factor transporter ATP-binding protein EcfA2
MRKTYLFTIDPTRQSGKPNKRDYNKISNQIVLVTGLTSEEIVIYSAPPYSYTFCTAILNGKRINKNWTGQQAFMLDFDSGITPKEVIEKLLEYGIIVNIIYYTFSHTEEHPRFRIVILLEEPIYDYCIADVLRKGLVQGLAGCDIKCKDAARMFLGGIRSEELSTDHTDIQKLLIFSSIQLVAGDNLQTRSLNKNGCFYNEYNRSTSFNANIQYSQNNAPRFEYLRTLKNNSFNFELAQNNLKIVYDFVEGRELKYRELFGLTTSLIHVKGGEKFLKETMNHYNDLGKTAYKPEDFAIIPVVKHYDYLPERLERYSPYPEDHKYTDVIDAVKKPRGEVQIITPTTKIKLSEAEAILNAEFDKAIQSNDNKIYIFSTQTAIGKTTKLTKLNNTTLAFPTHDLKNEIGCKMKVEHLVVPELPTFENKLVNEKIKALYQIGLNDDVYQLINTIAYFMDVEYSDHDRNLARKYLNLIAESNNTNKTVLTTHLRALFDQYAHNTVVFDEDPINSLLSIKQFELSDLLTLEQMANNQQPITQLINLIRSTPIGEITNVEFQEIDRHAIASLVSNFHTNSNLVQFFNATSFCKDKTNPNIIHYQIKREIPKGKKVIIMSATPQIEVYKSLYGNRVKVIDIPLAENQGNITQFTKNGFSRSYLKSNNVPDLVEQIGDRTVITFQKYKYVFPTAHPLIHFGNCEGYDFLNGSDLAVVGTPHKNELHYYFTAHALGIDLQEINCELQDLKVDWKGFRFRFSTYEDERLRNIQLAAIEAELVQAIGRARSLRTDAEVLVYSNLPLQICTTIRP